MRIPVILLLAAAVVSAEPVSVHSPNPHYFQYSGTQSHAKTAGGYQKGMAVFTVAKGGFMYEASIGGQKFNYKARK